MKTVETPAATTTAVTVWNAESEQLCKKLIAEGRSVPGAIAKSAPKGFLAELRRERRATIMSNSEALLGQLSKKGFKLHDMKDEKENGRTGDVSIWVQFKQIANPITRLLKETGMSIEELRTMVNGEKTVKA